MDKQIIKNNFLMSWTEFHLISLKDSLVNIIFSPSKIIVILVFAFSLNVVIVLGYIYGILKDFSNKFRDYQATFYLQNYDNDLLESLNKDFKKLDFIDGYELIDSNRELENILIKLKLNERLLIMDEIEKYIPSLIVINLNKKLTSSEIKKISAIYAKYSQITDFSNETDYVEKVRHLLKLIKEVLLIKVSLFIIVIGFLLNNSIKNYFNSNKNKMMAYYLLGASPSLISIPLSYRIFFIGLFSGILSLFTFKSFIIVVFQTISGIVKLSGDYNFNNISNIIMLYFSMILVLIAIISAISVNRFFFIYCREKIKDVVY